MDWVRFWNLLGVRVSCWYWLILRFVGAIFACSSRDSTPGEEALAQPDIFSWGKPCACSITTWKGKETFHVLGISLTFSGVRVKGLNSIYIQA